MKGREPAAPGSNIGGAAAGSGNNYHHISGTSFAAPHVAGAAALLAQKYPGFATRQIYDIVRSTGTGVFSGANSAQPERGPSLVGGGGVNAEAAATTNAFLNNTQVITATNLFGEVIEVTSDQTIQRNITLVWRGSQATTFNATLNNVATIPGVTVTIPNPTGPAVPNSTVNIPYLVNINPAALKRQCPPWFLPTQANNPRHCPSAFEFLIDSNFGSHKLKTGISSVVRPASQMGTTQTSLNLTGTTGTFPINLTGQGVNNGPTLPGDWRSFVSPLPPMISPNPMPAPCPIDGFIIVISMVMVCAI